jgi:hypothetical protein
VAGSGVRLHTGVSRQSHGLTFVTKVKLVIKLELRAPIRLSIDIAHTIPGGSRLGCSKPKITNRWSSEGYRRERHHCAIRRSLYEPQCRLYNREQQSQPALLLQRSVSGPKNSLTLRTTVWLIAMPKAVHWTRRRARRTGNIFRKVEVSRSGWER